MEQYKQSQLISIILPVFNGEKFLSEAIQSCLNQTHENFELIIVNDCSTDSSLRIAEKYSELDNRIRIITNDYNKKLPASLNVGHKAAEGLFLTWISDDNILKNIFLQTLLDSLKSGKADIVYSNYENIDSSGKAFSKQNVGCIPNLLFGNTVGASFLYKKEVYTELQGYDETLFTVEDYDFWLRASLKFSFCKIEDSLIYYRVHSSSLTSQLHNNIILKEKFYRAIEKSISNALKTLNWQQSSLKLIFSLQAQLNFSFTNYRNYYKQFQKDITLYRMNIITRQQSFCREKLDLIMRDFLTLGLIENSFSNLWWILINQPGVLFNKSYSKLKTIKLLFNFKNF